MARARAARRSFESKVAILEGAVEKKRVPEGVPRLRTLRDVVAWTGERDGVRFESWSSFTVAAPNGQNGDLRRRLDAVLPSFVSLQSGERPKGKRPPRGTKVEDWLVRLERDRLAQQNEALAAALKDEREARIRAEQTIGALVEDKAGLTKELNRIIPLRMRSQ